PAPRQLCNRQRQSRVRFCCEGSNITWILAREDEVAVKALSAVVSLNPGARADLKPRHARSELASSSKQHHPNSRPFSVVFLSMLSITTTSRRDLREASVRPSLLRALFSESPQGLSSTARTDGGSTTPATTPARMDIARESSAEISKRRS